MSGSSPLVGSLFSYDLQGKLRNQRGLRVKASGNLLRPTEEALLVEWKHDSAVRVALDDKLRSGHAGARGEVVLLP